LHAQHPDIYKDDNHKPEIAIALGDDFQALFGFLNATDLTKNLRENKGLAAALEWTEDTKVDGEFVKGCVKKMFYEIDSDHNRLEEIILQILNDINSLEEAKRSEHQKLFLILKDQYGTKDVGLLFAFFFNLFRLKRDEAVVITPNEPHAYLSGDLVECMANSDNVVRGGLTPKLKDKDTLYSMLPYDTVDSGK